MGFSSTIVSKVGLTERAFDTHDPPGRGGTVGEETQSELQDEAAVQVGLERPTLNEAAFDQVPAGSETGSASEGR